MIADVLFDAITRIQNCVENRCSKGESRLTKETRSVLEAMRRLQLKMDIEGPDGTIWEPGESPDPAELRKYPKPIILFPPTGTTDAQIVRTKRAWSAVAKTTNSSLSMVVDVRGDQRVHHEIPEVVQVCRKLVSADFFSVLRKPTETGVGYGAYEVWAVANGEFDPGQKAMPPQLLKRFQQDLGTAPAKEYHVRTWDIDEQAWTPQIGVHPGPYSLFGLRTALRRLRSLGYPADRNDAYVLVESRTTQAEQERLHFLATFGGVGEP